MSTSSTQVTMEQKLALIEDILHDPRKYDVQYHPAAKVTIGQHLRDLLLYYENTKVKHSQYTYNDGRTVGMLNIDALVPIAFHGQTYYIPVSIWLPEEYPQKGPICYVTPTANMMISPDHPQVDASGFIKTTYLVYWAPDRSNLVEIIGDLRKVFSQKPPVYSRPPQPAPNPQFQGSNPMTQRPPHVQRTSPSMPRQSTNQTPKVQNSGGLDQEEANREYRGVLIRALNSRTNGSLSDIIEQAQPEITRLTSEQSLLSDHAIQLQNRIHELQNERTVIEHNISTMGAIISQIDGWQGQVNVPSDSTSKPVPATEVVVPQDPLNSQFLDCQSEDIAIEETLNVLDLLLQKDKIDVESYLKQVRNLSRRQFYARALSIKIKSLQGR